MSFTLTYVDDSLFGCGLPGMPVLPEAQLLHRDLVVIEHNHHHTLQVQGEIASNWCGDPGTRLPPRAWRSAPHNLLN